MSFKYNTASNGMKAANDVNHLLKKRIS
jgi:hypothetical protein